MTQEQLNYYNNELYVYYHQLDEERKPEESVFSKEEKAFLNGMRRMMDAVKDYRRNPEDPEAFRKMKENFAAMAAMQPEDPWKSGEELEKGDYILAASMYRIQQAIKAENETLKNREKGGEPLETLLSANYSQNGGTLLRDQQEQYDQLLADAGALAELERELKDADSAFIPSSDAFKKMMTTLRETNQMVAKMSEKPDPAAIQALRTKMQELSAKALAYEAKKLNEGKGSDYAKKRTDLASRLIGKVGAALGDVSALSTQSMAETMGGYEKEEQAKWRREDNLQAQDSEARAVDALMDEDEYKRTVALGDMLGLKPEKAGKQREVITHMAAVFGTKAEKFPGDPNLTPQERKMAFLDRMMRGDRHATRDFVSQCAKDYVAERNAADQRDKNRRPDDESLREGDALRGDYYQEALRSLNTLGATEQRMGSRQVEIMSCCSLLRQWADHSKNMAGSRKLLEGKDFKSVKNCTEGSIQMGKIAALGVNAKRELMRMPDDTQAGTEDRIADLLTMKASEVFMKDSYKDAKKQVSLDAHAQSTLQKVLGGYISDIGGNITGSSLDANQAIRQTKAYDRLCKMDMKELKKIIAEDGETLHRFGQAAVQEGMKALNINPGKTAKSAQTKKAPTKLLADENSKKPPVKGMGN